jgi:hypothetical protein
MERERECPESLAQCIKEATGVVLPAHLRDNALTQPATVHDPVDTANLSNFSCWRIGGHL